MPCWKLLLVNSKVLGGVFTLTYIRHDIIGHVWLAVEEAYMYCNVSTHASMGLYHLPSIAFCVWAGIFGTGIKVASISNLSSLRTPIVFFFLPPATYLWCECFCFFHPTPFLPKKIGCPIKRKTFLYERSVTLSWREGLGLETPRPYFQCNITR